jgi:mannose/fructose/N-acetylgalactosamine-specific phosphotransferase system component IIB
MTVVLYRVDERLIHGQVVVGWGTALSPSRYVVVDDALAASEWEQELYGMGVPPDAEAEFVDLADAAERLPAWQNGDDRVVLLTRDVDTMRRLAETGLLNGQEVNIGGVHHAPGRTRVLRYVFLNDGDRRGLEDISGHGATVVARDLPGARPVGLDDLVRSS